MKNRYEMQFVGLLTLLEKEVIRFFRIWTQALLPPAITITLYFIIFGKLIGSQIQPIHGIRYMEYIIPGLIMMTIMTNAYSNTASSFFGAKFSKSIEELLISPLSNYIILWGFVLGGALRGVLTGLVVYLISLFFSPIKIHDLAITLSMAILSALVFALAGLINAIYAKRFDDVSFIPTFVLTPLTYLGGVFYSVKQLPYFWQKISYLNPVLNIVETVKFGMLGHAEIDITVGFVLVLVLLVILYFWCLYLLREGTGLRS